MGKRGYTGRSREHSLNRRGIKTAKKMSRAVAKPKVEFVERGTSMHGYIDRSFDEFRYKVNGDEVSVYIFREPDFEMIRELAREEGITTDKDYQEFLTDESMDFFKRGKGEVHVVWEGALDFTGTVFEFRDQYPEIFEDLEGELV